MLLPFPDPKPNPDLLSTILGLVKEVVEAAGSGADNPNATTPFDAASQLVDVTGQYAVIIMSKDNCRTICKFWGFGYSETKLISLSNNGLYFKAGEVDLLRKTGNLIDIRCLIGGTT